MYILIIFLIAIHISHISPRSKIVIQIENENEIEYNSDLEIGNENDETVFHPLSFLFQR